MILNVFLSDFAKRAKNLSDVYKKLIEEKKEFYGKVQHFMDKVEHETENPPDRSKKAAAAPGANDIRKELRVRTNFDDALPTYRNDEVQTP